ncbi:hypothetical protein B0H13DRAFT_2340272 [Mycena leptocephala]|nr:hypothetical protein B0H13DRAFT_2340272 [Mycena leptocephala]
MQFKLAVAFVAALSTVAAQAQDCLTILEGSPCETARVVEMPSTAVPVTGTGGSPSSVLIRTYHIHHFSATQRSIKFYQPQI